MTNQPVLRRDSAHRVAGGVCSGLARLWGVDPLLVRAGFIVATVVSSGLGVVAYAILWVLLPTDRESRRRRPGLTPLSLAAIVAVLVLASGMALPESRFAAAGLAIVGVLALGWYTVTKAGRRHSIPRVPVEPEPQWKQPPSSPRVVSPVVDATAPAASGVGGAAPGPAARPRTWARVLLSTMIVWSGLSFLGAVGVPVRPVAYPASCLAILGATLIAASLPRRVNARRVRGLAPAGLVAALATVSMLVPSGAPSGTSTTLISKATDVPELIELDMGNHIVDLSGLTLSSDRTMTITEDAGTLTLLLPSSANVDARYQIDAGSLTTPRIAARQGLDMAIPELYDDAPGKPTLTVTVQLSLGNLEVRR